MSRHQVVFVIIEACDFHLTSSISLTNAISIPISTLSTEAITSESSPPYHPIDPFQTLQPARQLHTSEVSHTNSRTRQRADHAVHQGTESQMPSNTSPSTRQLSGRVPPHTELQWQRITNDNPGRRFARNAVRGRSRNCSRRNRLGRRVNQHIHARGNVQVAELQCARKRDDHRRVDIAQAALSVCFFCGALLELIFQCAGRERLGRYAASQGRVVVDVEFQQVEKRVVDEVDRAVNLLLYSEEELQRAAGFIASRERDV